MSKPKRRSHSGEFQREAVTLVTGQGYSLAEAARNLGIHANLLRTWKRTFTTEAAEEQDLTEEERLEPARLRAENKRLRRERDLRTKRRPAAGGLKPLRGLREREALRFEFIEQHREEWRFARDRLPPASSLIGRQRPLLVRSLGGVTQRLGYVAETFGECAIAASTGTGVSYAFQSEVARIPLRPPSLPIRLA